MFFLVRGEFSLAPCLLGGGGELDDRLRLDVVETARVPDMVPSLFSSWLG